MDHHALQGRLHAELHHLARAVRRRLATAQEGQGTVEYVALILLVGLLLGAAVAATSKTQFDLAGTVRDRLDEAIKGVGEKAKAK
jgi:hypothetical protein